MHYVGLVVVIVLVTAQSVLTCQYNRKAARPNSFLFAGFTAGAAMLFFGAQNGFLIQWEPALIPYSVGFGLSFAAVYVGMSLSLKYGPLSVTSLVTAYSLLIPTMYGLFWLGDKLGKFAVVGLALLAVSLPLIYLKKEKVTVNARWVGGLVLTFFGNGLCSTLQKMQQLAFDGGYKSEFMIYALLIGAVIMLVGAALGGGMHWRDCKAALPWATVTGLANGACNLLVMLLTAVVPTAVLFPCVSAGGIVLGFVIAVVWYKEKNTPVQIVGYVMGTVSVVLMNL